MEGCQDAARQDAQVVNEGRFHIRLPRQLSHFAFRSRACARVTVRIGGQPYIVYCTRGVRYVLIRGSARDRPWQCSRVSVFNGEWDRVSNIEREDFLVAFLRKLQRPAQGSLDRPDAVDPQMVAVYPALHEHLTRTRDDDGAVRQTCSLTVFGHAGGFKAFLNDRDSGGSIGVQSDSFTGLLKALEAELESDAPSWFWRQAPESGGGKGRGKRA